MLAAPPQRCCDRLDRFLADSPRVEFVGQADAEGAALHLYFRVRPDVTVLDWRVSAHEPARFIGLLRRVVPDARVVAIVPSLDSVPARAASALGADIVTTCDELPSALDRLVSSPSGAAVV